MACFKKTLPVEHVKQRCRIDINHNHQEPTVTFLQPEKGKVENALFNSFGSKVLPPSPYLGPFTTFIPPSLLLLQLLLLLLLRSITTHRSATVTVTAIVTVTMTFRCVQSRISCRFFDPNSSH